MESMDKEVCLVCGKGLVVRRLEYIKTPSEDYVKCYYTKCTYCRTEYANRDQVKANKEIMVAYLNERFNKNEGL